jgi:hypothetical protein
MYHKRVKYKFGYFDQNSKAHIFLRFELISIMNLSLYSFNRKDFETKIFFQSSWFLQTSSLTRFRCYVEHFKIILEAVIRSHLLNGFVFYIWVYKPTYGQRIPYLPLIYVNDFRSYSWMLEAISKIENLNRLFQNDSKKIQKLRIGSRLRWKMGSVSPRRILQYIHILLEFLVRILLEDWLHVFKKY